MIKSSLWLNTFLILDCIIESKPMPCASDNPLFSIVIATFNDGNILPCAIESVLNQDFSGDYELIVIDGGSKDQTHDVLRQYSKQLLQ